MGSLFAQLINMLMLGSTYTLVALCFTLFFGVMDVVVFCVGDVAIFAAYAAIGLTTLAALVGGAKPMLMIFVVGLASLLTGLLMIAMYKIVIQPLERKGSHMTLLSTIAAGLVLREGLGIFFPKGRDPQVFPKIIPNIYFFNNPMLSYRNIVILGLMLCILGALYFFVSHTKLGIAVQAVAQNRERAITIGINSKAVVLTTLMVGGFILGVSGFLLGEYYGIVRYDMGIMYGLMGFSAAVVGGVGNVNGAIIGGMILAVVQVLISAFVPGGTAYADIASFIVVIVLLLTRPEGILGKKTVENV